MSTSTVETECTSIFKSTKEARWTQKWSGSFLSAHGEWSGPIPTTRSMSCWPIPPGTSSACAPESFEQ